MSEVLETSKQVMQILSFEHKERLHSKQPLRDRNTTIVAPLHFLATRAGDHSRKNMSPSVA